MKAPWVLSALAHVTIIWDMPHCADWQHHQEMTLVGSVRIETPTITCLPVISVKTAPACCMKVQSIDVSVQFT